jgi:putative DNA primase/helicase
VLCEGVATGLTIFNALPQSRVVIGFSAANLIALAESLKWVGWAVVAGDNDHETARELGRNPGWDAATKAAQIIGCGVAVPEDIRGTDWNDYFAESLDRREASASRHTLHHCRQAALAEVGRLIHAQAVWLPPLNSSTP